MYYDCVAYVTAIALQYIHFKKNFSIVWVI